MAVDLNGHKGPNKWGTDLHTFRLVLKDKYKASPTVSYYGNGYLMESGGKTLKSILDLN